MKRHAARIHEEKDQICALCPAKKFYAAGLKIHIRKIHVDGKYPFKSFGNFLIAFDKSR